MGKASYSCGLGRYFFMKLVLYLAWTASLKHVTDTNHSEMLLKIFRLVLSHAYEASVKVCHFICLIHFQDILVLTDIQGFYFFFSNRSSLFLLIHNAILLRHKSEECIS